MRVIVPRDHGATDNLEEQNDRVVVRPHDYPEDTYPALWFWFGVQNDAAAPVERGIVRIENLPAGADTYEPFWRYCLWRTGGRDWERIPRSSQRIGDGVLEIAVDLAPGQMVEIAETIPLPYGHYADLHNAMLRLPASGIACEYLTPGETAGGRPIRAYHVHLERSAPRRNILVLAGQHAVEQSGKLFAETVLRGYHSGRFAGTAFARLLETHNVLVAPVANPDGCYDGRMNSNSAGTIMDAPEDDSPEMRAMMLLVDEYRPEVVMNCHGWGNEMGTPPYEDVYRWTDDDALYRHLVRWVPGCSSSSAPHLIGDTFRLENYAREVCGAACAMTELNWSWQAPDGGGAPFHPTRADLEARTLAYFEAVAGFCAGSART